jgi:hypothetical protein
MEKNLLTRREFQFSALKASAALLLPRLCPAAVGDASEISALYRRATVIDTLCSPFVDAEDNPSPSLVKTRPRLRHHCGQLDRF